MSFVCVPLVSVSRLRKNKQSTKTFCNVCENFKFFLLVFLKMRTPITSGLPCPTFRSRIASDLFKAAKVLEKGEVICVPTDTVYALAGSCSKPDSISKIYHIKGRPPEKSICLCISNLQQLRVANPPFR